MVSSLLQAIAALIVSVISLAGYPGICLLMAIESACIPLPSEVIMPFSGYLVFAGRFKLLWVAVAGALGCNLGSAVAYYVGVRGGRPLAEKYGRYVLVSRHDLDRADHWFARYGNATVFFARLLPVIRTFIALPAGVARMNFWQFNLYTFAGSLPWCWLLAYAGLRLGAKWESLRTYFHRFDAVVGVALGAAFVWFVYTHWKDRLRGEQRGVGDLKPQASSRKPE
jgi:membrane protein DedA with SNARE-associated domain